MTQPHLPDAPPDRGVPEALPRTLVRLRGQLGVESIDRVWIFPPARHGRREQGLVAVSTFLEGEERRAVVTVAYRAEHSGTGVTVETSFTQEGEALPDHFPAVMAGVVRRSGEALGDAREVEIAGSPRKFEELMEEFDMAFLQTPQP